MSADVVQFPRRGGPPTGLGAAGGGGVDAVSSHLGSPITTHIPRGAQHWPVDLAVLTGGGVHHGRGFTAPRAAVSCGQLRVISAAVPA
jgi:hypothetical protein